MSMISQWLCCGAAGLAPEAPELDVLLPTLLSNTEPTDNKRASKQAAQFAQDGVANAFGMTEPAASPRDEVAVTTGVPTAKAETRETPTSVAQQSQDAADIRESKEVTTHEKTIESGPSLAQTIQSPAEKGEIQREEGAENAADEELKMAAAAGQYAAAYRKLVEMRKQGRDPCEVLSADAVERIARIYSKFHSAQQLLKMTPESFKVSEINKVLKLQWGVQVEGDSMQIISIMDYDADFIKVVALDQECDLEDKISQDDICAASLCVKPHIHDCSWRKRSKSAGLGTKADDVFVVSSVDALDEPDATQQAVYVLKYTLSEGSTVDPFGTAVPSVDAGHARSPYVFSVSMITPLGLAGNAFQGARKISVTEVKLPSVVAKLLGVMPTFMLKKMTRGSVEMAAQLSASFLLSSELTERLQSSPRAAFYEQVRNHISAKQTCA